MQKEYFSIGEVAKLKNVTIKALRYYHDIGLLTPSYIDESNGYRYYSLEKLIHIDIIRLCRNAGVTIKELQSLYAHADMDYLLQFLAQKNDEIQEKITNLEQSMTTIQSLTEKITTSRTIIADDQFKFQDFPERYLLTKLLEHPEGVDYLFDYFQLGENLNHLHLQSLYEQGLYYTLTPDEKWQAAFVFELITKNDFNRHPNRSDFTCIPEGTYLTVTTTKENEKKKLDEILHVLAQKDLSPEFVLSFDVYDELFNLDEFYCQLQVFVA